MDARDVRTTGINAEAARTLARVLPRLERTLAAERSADPAGWDRFTARLTEHFATFFGPYLQLYGERYDFFYGLEQTLEMTARSWFDRPDGLRELDARREGEPDWFQSQRMMGGVCYVDRFAGDLAGVRAKIPYFQELGLTYLHLMPLFRAPEGNSDGGYAVSSYREVDPKLGTMADLTALATDLRAAGISLVLDFVFNHTSDEHPWAIEARAHPDDEDRNAYWLFPDRTLPDAYERTLREIFPDQRPGSFTWDATSERWVWTTFNSFQWDLNYSNPLVFQRMAGEMLFLANRGVEILRLDAVAFIWKRLGTPCESLPEAHLIVRAFNALARIAAPALIFKSEAIVHPAEVATYIAPEECQISYNPLQMAVSWEALATRSARLLRRSMAHWFALPAGTAWVNYVRSHDDIGWTFDDADAAELWINGYDHRRFLNAFYTGRFPGTFARGLPFQENPRTGDARISGTTASLAGLEKALGEEGPAEVELALRRILLLYGIALSIGGIPLLYLGDELATRNDYGFRDDPDEAGDSRWVHRPRLDPARLAARHDTQTPEGRLFGRLVGLIRIRQSEPAFAGSATTILDPGNDQVFGYLRHGAERQILALVNVTESVQTIAADAIRAVGFAGSATDLVSGETIDLANDVTLTPYQFVWFTDLEAS